MCVSVSVCVVGLPWFRHLRDCCPHLQRKPLTDLLSYSHILLGSHFIVLFTVKILVWSYNDTKISIEIFILIYVFTKQLISVSTKPLRSYQMSDYPLPQWQNEGSKKLCNWQRFAFIEISFITKVKTQTSVSWWFPTFPCCPKTAENCSIHQTLVKQEKKY